VCLGLADLFGTPSDRQSSCSAASAAHRRRVHCDSCVSRMDCCVDELKDHENLRELGRGRNGCGGSDVASPTPFFALRLEHREVRGGNNTARFGDGEERILLFRTDKPGAVGKIVYSSSPSSSTTISTPSINSKTDCAKQERDELPVSEMAQATIHVLNVKERKYGEIHKVYVLLLFLSLGALIN